MTKQFWLFFFGDTVYLDNL